MDKLSDYDKTKVTIALALLAALFALWPAVDSVNAAGAVVWGLTFRTTLRTAYFGMVSLLGIGVWLYAVQYAFGESGNPVLLKIGHVVYAVSMSLPLVLPTWGVVWLLQRLTLQMSSSLLLMGIVKILIALVVGSLFTWLIGRIKKALLESEARSWSKAAGSDGLAALLSSRKLADEDRFDLSIQEAYRAAELYIRMAAGDHNAYLRSRPLPQIITALREQVALPPETLNIMAELQRMRNVSVHKSEQFDRDAAVRAGKLAGEVMVSVVQKRGQDELARAGEQSK